MKRAIGIRVMGVLALAAGATVFCGSAGPQAPKAAPKPALPPAPKLLKQSITGGINYLAAQQQLDGGWGPGEGVGVQPALVNPKAKNGPRTDVGNTSIAALALLRNGSTPGSSIKQGLHAKHLAKAVDYVCNQVEKSKPDALSLGDPDQPTELQRKLGQFTDSFLAILFLAEVKGKMPDAKGEARVAKALETLVDRMEKHQQSDGTWASGKLTKAWAPVLAQALALPALHRARQAGASVDEKVLEKYGKNSVAWFERQWKPPPAVVAKPAPPKSMADESPGITGTTPTKKPAPPKPPPPLGLHASASYLGAVHTYYLTLQRSGANARNFLDSPNATPAEKAQAKAQLKQLTDAERVFTQANRYVTKRLADPQFLKGFGADGGEEYLCFLLIGEALRAQDLKEWTALYNTLAERLLSSQNRDGSWSGKHCITGQTFCTATALLILMSERPQKNGP